MREQHHMEIAGECGSGKTQLCMQVSLTSTRKQHPLITRLQLNCSDRGNKLTAVNHLKGY